MIDPESVKLKDKYKVPRKPQPGFVNFADVDPEEAKLLEEMWDQIGREKRGECPPASVEEPGPEAA